MKLSRAAAAAAFLLAVPAYGQSIKPPAPTDPPKSQSEIESEKSADKAYKNSLRNIPDQPAADPWGGAHSLETSKPATATTTTSKRTKASSN